MMKGLRALEQALQSDGADERIHNFVRAIEAVLKPKRGNTTKQFVDRCTAAFTMLNAANRDALRDIYEIRSAVEHLNPIEDALTRHPADTRDGISYKRLAQAEALALKVWSDLALSADLRRLLADDALMQAFWAKPEDEIGRLWSGTRLDLESIG